jgi:hypothetical protein
MNRMLSAALGVATMASAMGVSHAAHADGTRISIAPFQSRQAWQANWDDLNRRGNDAGAQWERHGDTYDLYFIVKPGVKAHLATERYGRGYCYIVEGETTADCYREDGKKTVWTLDKPFDYGLAPQSTPAPTYVAPAPTYTPPPPSASPPPPTGGPSAGFAVQTYDIPGVMNNQLIHVSVGTASYNMTLDTGASNMTVSAAVADWLVSTGQATELTAGKSAMADGRESVDRRISIASVTLAGHTIHDVMAGVIAPGQADGDMLFGLGALKRFGKFTVDSDNHQLTFG